MFSWDINNPFVSYISICKQPPLLEIKRSKVGVPLQMVLMVHGLSTWRMVTKSGNKIKATTSIFNFLIMKPIYWSIFITLWTPVRILWGEKKVTGVTVRNLVSFPWIILGELNDLFRSFVLLYCWFFVVLVCT